MLTRNNLMWLILAFIIGFMLLYLALGRPMDAYGVEELKIGGNGYSCVDADNRWKTETTSSATLPFGYQVQSVVVKAGQDCVTVYPSNSAPTCYEVTVEDGSVEVEKIGDGKTCKDISHLEGTYLVVPVPTDEISPTPTIDVTPTVTGTPSATPTVTPTNTPSGGGSGGDGRSDGLSSCPECTKAPAVVPAAPPATGRAE